MVNQLVIFQINNFNNKFINNIFNVNNNSIINFVLQNNANFISNIINCNQESICSFNFDNSSFSSNNTFYIQTTV